MFKMLLDFCAVCQTYIIKEVLCLFPEDSYFKMIHSCKYLIFCEKTGFLKINMRVLTAAVLMIPRTWKLLGFSFGFCLILLFETGFLCVPLAVVELRAIHLPLQCWSAGSKACAATTWHKY